MVDLIRLESLPASLTPKTRVELDGGMGTVRISPSNAKNLSTYQRLVT